MLCNRNLRHLGNEAKLTPLSTEVISDLEAQINALKEKYDALQPDIETIIEQWKHFFQSNESYSKFRDKVDIYVEEAYKFVEKFYFQLSLQHTSKQLVENVKLRDKPRGMDTNGAFSPDEPTIHEIVRQEIKVAIKAPHSGKMSQSKRGNSVAIKKSPVTPKEKVPKTVLVVDHNLDQSPEATANRDLMLPRNLLCLKVKSLKTFEIAP